MTASVLSAQDTGLYYHRYLQEVINVLETDGHFREKLQAANAEDIKVRVQGAGLIRRVPRALGMGLPQHDRGTGMLDVPTNPHMGP